MNDHFELNHTDQAFTEAQALLQALLSETDRICKQKALTYSLFFDTLWGALCHRNFRAGSENAHIVLTRADYETLLEALSEGRINARFYLELPGGAEDSIRPYARLCCRNTKAQRIPELPLSNNSFPVSLSLLPLDSVAANDAVQARRLRHIRAWTDALRIKGPNVDSVTEEGRSGDGTIELKEVFAKNTAVEQVAPSALEIWLKSLLPKRLAIRRRQQLMCGRPSDRQDKYAIYQPMSGLVAVIYCNAQQIFPVASIPLGRKAYSCPGKAHEVLTNLYGDYRCDLGLTEGEHEFAAFEIDRTFWADVIYADDPALVL